ncbi:hypothetical protein DW817_02000 [Acidaminococcus sp. AM33-14BH]|nr:hypothetical protein DW817_02000 [Acidaminococcus sp. AM33-14BH]
MILSFGWLISQTVVWAQKKHAKKACKQNRSIHCLSTWGSLYAGSFCYFTAKIKVMQQKEVVKNERCTFYSLFFYGIVSILKQWGHVMAANRIDFCSE